MMFRPSAACAVLALGALLPAAAAAQSTDAFVLPFGMFRLGAEGMHASYDSYFDASGSPVQLGENVGGELTPARLAALRPLVSHLSDFLEATQAEPGASPGPPDPEAISLGLLDVAAAASRTEARARFSIGILPRLEVGASIPIGRSERLIHRLDLADGDVGLNPDPTGNAELLTTIGWASLGESPLLPTAGSPLGMELQSRVTAITGEPLSLPASPATLTALQNLLQEHYGLPAIASRVEPWRVGDLELEARGLLLSTFGNGPVPVDAEGLQLRVAILAGARLPTGTGPDSLPLLATQPTERLSNLHAGGTGDVFLGERFWFTGALRLTWGRSTEVVRRIAPADAPLSAADPPGPVRISPGNALELRLAPRFRLAESISLGGEYALSAVGDTRFTASDSPEGRNAELLNLAGGSLHRLGLGIRYSSLPAYWVQQASFPAEVTLEYHRTLSGPEGMRGGGAVTVTASVLPRLW